MEHIKRFFKIQRNIIVLLLVLLAMSIVANLYFGVIRPLQEGKDEEEIYVWTENGRVIIFIEIQGGMGSMSVLISRGLIVGPGHKFNISIGVKLWDPYTGSKTYNFSFKLYQRSEQSDRYPDMPITETTVVAQKGKDAMYVIFESGNLTVTTPYTHGIYIYKVWFGTITQTWRTFEVPIWVVPGPIISPNV